MDNEKRKITYLFFTVLVAVSTISVSAQRTIFRWGYTNGTYTGIFDSKKYNKQQVDNTYALTGYRHIYMFDDNSISQAPHTAEPALRILDEAYKKDIADLEALDIVPGPYWKSLKQKRVLQLRKYYEFLRATFLGYSDPKALLAVNGAAACKNVYAKSLITGGDRLLQVWRQVNIRSRKDNSDPKSIISKYKEQLSSPQRQTFAFDEVISYGWWNCVVNEINRAFSRKAMENQFHRLFTRIFLKNIR